MSGGSVHCATCGARWFGLLYAHCSECHNTFSRVIHFDAHQGERRNNRYTGCKDPAEVGLQRGRRSPDVWVAGQDEEGTDDES